MLIRVSYPIYPLITLGIGALAVVGVFAGLLVIMGGERRFEIAVDGQVRRIAVKVFRSAQVRSQTGEVIGTIKRRMGRPEVSEVAQGHSITVKA